jgi:hypothetical protein
VTWVMWSLVLVRLEIVLVSVQDRCMVCAKRTTGLEIILETRDGTASDVGLVESCFGLFGIVLILTQDRCIVCVECTIASEIILDTPDGTPR